MEIFNFLFEICEIVKLFACCNIQMIKVEQIRSVLNWSSMPTNFQILTKYNKQNNRIWSYPKRRCNIYKTSVQLQQIKSKHLTIFQSYWKWQQLFIKTSKEAIVGRARLWIPIFVLCQLKKTIILFGSNFGYLRK